MKRFHIHVGVKNLPDSVSFYSRLFGAEPVKLRDDYAKWMLEDPRINFAISTRVAGEGVDHLGIQVEKEEELAELVGRLKKAKLDVFAEGDTTCCYSRSAKAWVTDPAGIAWEAYRNMGEAEVFREKTVEKASCCAPAADTKNSCC